jgi:hypothetical protein
MIANGTAPPQGADAPASPPVEEIHLPLGKVIHPNSCLL